MKALLNSAIAKAFNIEIKKVRKAILVSGNIAKVAIFSKKTHWIS